MTLILRPHFMETLTLYEYEKSLNKYSKLKLIPNPPPRAGSKRPMQITNDLRFLPDSIEPL